jgi:peptidoglycan DL-endopeptidase CwlO
LACHQPVQGSAATRGERVFKEVGPRVAVGIFILAAYCVVAATPGQAATPTSATHSKSSSPCAGLTKSIQLPDFGPLKATKSEVATIEKHLASAQLCITNLSERYDEDTYRLTKIDASLEATQSKLVSARHLQATTRSQLQSAAVNSYMFDEPAVALASLFPNTSVTSSLQSAYTDDALGNVAADLAEMKSVERQLASTEKLLLSQRTEAVSDARESERTEKQAAAATSVTEATLSKVKGRLAQQVAAEAVLQAQHDAAEVASAASAWTKKEDAISAEQAAQVAQTLGNGSGNAAANGAGSAAGDHRGSPPRHPSTNVPGLVAVEAAQSYLGVPYVWGGASRAGVDCSGLVMLAWEAAGVSLAHSAAIQALESKPVPLSQLEPGDLLFYDFDGDGIEHVAMYVGSGPYGADTIIQAAHTGTLVSYDQIYYEGLVGAGMP